MSRAPRIHVSAAITCLAWEGGSAAPSAEVWTFFLRGGGMRAVPGCIGPGIPTGFRLKAQGCEARATLGNRRPRIQPQRGCVSIPNVVLHSPNEDGRTIQPFGNLSQIRVQPPTKLLIPKKWTTVFGGEDEVNVNDRQGLGHRFPFIRGRNPVGVVAFAVYLPRVARTSQPWALRRNPFGIFSRIFPNSRGLKSPCNGVNQPNR